MIVNDLYISEYVIDEVGQCVGCFCSHHSDAADKRTIHRSLNESEDVLNAASVLGLDAVALFLLVGQRIVAMPFLTDDWIHSFLPYDGIIDYKRKRQTIYIFMNVQSGKNHIFMNE